MTERSMVPDDSLTIRERAVAAWPTAWHGQNLRDILVTLGFDVDRPWRELPQDQRDWILFTDEQPVVPVYAGIEPDEVQRALQRQEEPSYQGTFSSARRHVLHTFTNSGSLLMKKRAAQYMLSTAGYRGTTSGTSTSRSRWVCSPPSRGSLAPASRAW